MAHSYVYDNCIDVQKMHGLGTLACHSFSNNCVFLITPQHSYLTGG